MQVIPERILNCFSNFKDILNNGLPVKNAVSTKNDLMYPIRTASLGSDWMPYNCILSAVSIISVLNKPFQPENDVIIKIRGNLE